MESTVNFNTKLKEAASFGQPITEYDPGSRGYKDFVNLARELMGHTPVELEPTPMDKLSRPAELVQRARQLAQLTTLQFGRNTVLSPNNGQESPSLTPLMASSASSPVGEPAMSIGRMPSASRIVEQPMIQVSSGALALSSEDEELDDATPPNRFGPSSGNGNGNGNGNGKAHGNGNGNGHAASTTPVVPKTTAQKIDEFYGVKKVGDDVIFAARFTEAKKVLIAGDFNNWSPMSTPMINRGRPGDFWMCLPLQPGRYRYRFVVDGKWMTDPHNKYVEVNQFGELNNVIEVE
jgi:hypothetical protein